MTVRVRERFPFIHRRQRLRFAVLGAGNGGMAMAGHLALNGFPVVLYNRTPDKLAGVIKAGGIHMQGELDGYARLAGVTHILKEAVHYADVLMVVVPAFGHRSIAAALAPHLRDGQVIVLHPGRTLGAMEFEQVLRLEGCKASVLVAEASTLLYASRVTGPATARVFRVKRKVRVAALPAYRTAEVVSLLNKALGSFVPAKNILETGLRNIGAVFHPAPTLLNMGRIEAGTDFDYYCQGITPSIARVLEAIDAERLAVARAFELDLPSAHEWLEDAYGARGEDLYDAVTNNQAYVGIKAPDSVYSRYISEDVPMSLVPISSLGDLAGTPTPAIDSVITLASVAHGVDYFATGRNLLRLGLEGVNARELLEYVHEGSDLLWQTAAN